MADSVVAENGAELLACYFPCETPHSVVGFQIGDLILKRRLAAGKLVQKRQGGGVQVGRLADSADSLADGVGEVSAV